MASLGWVVQFVIVVAILAGFFWVPEWWKARSDLRAAEEERDVLGQLLDAENAYDGMIQALNSVMALVDDATDLRLAANFQSAAASLDSARSVWREAPLSDCDALEANTDSNPGARVLVLLCTNRRQVDELIRLERVAIDGRMLVEDESLVTSWEDRSNAIDTNSQAVERLMDMIRAQSRE